MIIAFDIDGVIAERNKTVDNITLAFATANPIDGAKEAINALYDEGHTIIFFTARYKEDRTVTEAWLTCYGFKYHKLVLDKPQYDIFIDDKALKFTSWRDVNEEIRRSLNV